MTKPSIESVLREFMSDIEAVGAEQTRHNWPDLLVTYNKARMALSVQLDSRPTGTDTKWQTDEEFAALDNCKACSGDGVLFVSVDGFDAPEGMVFIQRCDACERYANDIDAAVGSGRTLLAVLARETE